MSKIFLSHSSVDKVFVRWLWKELERVGHEVWVDEGRIRGGEWLISQIKDGINNADYVIAILSPAAHRSGYFNTELSAAISAERKKGRALLIPLLYKKCKIPNMIAGKRYLDFTSRRTKALPELVEALGGISNNIETKECVVSLDVRSVSGKLVQYSKTQTVKCTSGELRDYTECLSTDGSLSGFGVKPGTIDKIWVESGVTHVKTLFPSPVFAGESAKRTFTCKFVNSFIQDQEYWDERQHNPSRNVEIRVLFPPQRPPTMWKVFEKRGDSRKEMRLKIKRMIIGRRVMLRLKIYRPRLHSDYQIRWWW